MSQFTGNPLAKDKLSAIFDVDQYASASKWPSAPISELTDAITWPNTVGLPSPGQLGDGFKGFINSGGFLVPPKCVGAVSAVQIDSSGSAEVSVLSVPKGNAFAGGWFYHMALPLDVDGDGLEDLITARAIKPIIGQSGGELVWLKRPAGASPLAPSSLPWEEAVLANGTGSPDVFFAFVCEVPSADGPGSPARLVLRGAGSTRHTAGCADPVAMVHTAFFSGEGLWITAPRAPRGTKGRWANGAMLQRVQLDGSIGQSFGVQLADIDGQGQGEGEGEGSSQSLELLVTNHVDNATLAGVYAYRLKAGASDPLQPASWERAVLTSGFTVRIPGPGQAAPGAAAAFTPCSGAAAEGAPAGLTKPWVVVAGDGDERVYLLSPQSQKQEQQQEQEQGGEGWAPAFDRNLLSNCAGTTGAPVVGDLDGDGAQEVLVPCYDTGFVQLWSFKDACSGSA